jgi:hypothetical protein
MVFMGFGCGGDHNFGLHYIYVGYLREQGGELFEDCQVIVVFVSSCLPVNSCLVDFLIVQKGSLTTTLQL